MNQILVTKKLYVTPELKKKKKLYKFEFFVSVFLVCVLLSAYIYAEYDRNKSEQLSQEILANLDIPEDTTIAKNNVLVVVLDDMPEAEPNETETNPSSSTSIAQAMQKTSSGYYYKTVATINIPKINVTYPIIDGPTDSAEETEDLLKISPTRFWGPEPNEVGNFCIVGHNYRNSRFFSKVPNLIEGDTIEITDLSGKMIPYKVYTKYQVDPTDVSCTTQLTNGRKEITLITCTDDSKYRVVVKAREVK
ncbi:MAG: sortase [Clostridia bacterium]|nr:sortase [Clostridia bacterium]